MAIPQRRNVSIRRAKRSAIRMGMAVTGRRDKSAGARSSGDQGADATPGLAPSVHPGDGVNRMPEVVRALADIPEIADALQAVASLGLPDWWIGGGFVRDRMWDRMHGFNQPTPSKEIEVLYYDPIRTRSDDDRRLEGILREECPGLPWKVTNQAWIHAERRDRPYLSVMDAMRHMPDTASAVAASITRDGRVRVLAPFGVDDLLSLKLRPSPHYQIYKPGRFREWIADKNWIANWPKLRVLDAQS